VKSNVTASEDGLHPHADAPSINIAGKQWPVPQLSPRQNRLVVPALLDVLPKIIRAREQATVQKDGGSLTQLAHYLDTTAYDKLTDIVFHALSRAHPDLKREDFDDMPVDTAELFAAMSVIAHQAGLFKPANLGQSLP
jgi:hypothetical protein